MKCIRYIKTGKVVRVPDDVAAIETGLRTAVYVPKSIWKEEGRKYEGLQGTAS